jgi:hypothetical protein
MSDAVSKLSLDAKVRSIQQQLNERFPDLTASSDGSTVCIHGTFTVIQETMVLDRFQIEIEWSDSDKEAPILREPGGRIPRTNERHMGLDGKACPLVPEEWLIRARSARTVIHYLDGPVHDYLLWQCLTDHGFTPSWGQRSHNVAGLIEAYGDMVGMEGENAVIRCLEYLAKKKFRGHWTCACGSGRPLRDCHFKHLRRLQQRISRNVI